ncbi:MAG TPA: alanine--tRNA ligase [bacterium]|nr:alanine--tRNA ligase [bacterium]
MKLDEIRNRFLNYFQKNGHEVVPSAPLIPEGDPTLLFTNAGMNQFKDTFLGAEKRPYVRAATAQKCFRASGKHNDLENVGRTARHHTFFEMLGNFSFGDYFKADAIRFAWEFMTVDMALPKDRLWITVFRDDDEAFELWRKVANVPAERIIRLGEKDNFWAMGDTGPCGPCSEIHYDQGPEIGCRTPQCKIGCECDRYLELWNLVFMQYSRDASGKMTPLPRPSIDTGMGIERIAAVMQGVYSNYDTDLFQAIIRNICAATGAVYKADPQQDVSIRVIADHARAMAFLIADGVLPSNEGRGYVLRRVMRRAGRHAKMLGRDEPVLFKIAQAVGDIMGEAYPELGAKRSFIAEVIKNEEERFLETLDAGLRILQEEIFKHTSRGMVENKLNRMINESEDQQSSQEDPNSPTSMQKATVKNLARFMEEQTERAAVKQIWKISGELAFKLYDTYGFPLDLTQTIAEEQGLDVDVAGFEKAMDEQRERAREHWKGSGEEVVDAVYKEVKTKAGGTEFLGYQTTRATARVLSLIVDGKTADKVDKAGQAFQLIADRTPFYGESGGQVGDTGRIVSPGLEIKVVDAKKPLENLIVHHCILEKGAVAAGDTVNLEVDEAKRMDTARNHSATHLLQAALREIVGDHVHQKGSLVTPDRFRFDLTHFSPVTADQLRQVETRVNQWVRENHEINLQVLSHKEAVKKGAMALFGEKYGETVRMVEMGPFSRELCGGTHARRTGDVGMFKVVAESSVAAGVRRIEAVTGRAAVAEAQRIEDQVKEAALCLRANPGELKDRINKLQDEIKNLKKELRAEREKKLTGGGSDIFSKIKNMNGVQVLVAEVEVADGKDLRPLGDQVKDKLKSGVAVLGAKANDKAHLLAVVTKDLTGRIKAGDIVKEIAPIVGGKGGGRPDFAQAGGPDQDKLAEALKKALEVVESKI